MQKYTFVVLTNAVEDREGEYNDWYDSVHLPDVLKVSGFVAAQRFRLSKTDPAQAFTHQYLAVYEVETDDLDRTSRLLSEVSGSSAMVISDALDRVSTTKGYFEPISERLTVSALGDNPTCDLDRRESR